MRNVDAAWCAGLFDGEGCVAVVFGKDERSRHGGNYRLYCSVQMCDSPTIEHLHDLAGGSTQVSQRITQGGRVAYKWVISGNEDILRFLHDIHPYAVTKSSQIEMALASIHLWQTTRPGRRVTTEIQAGRALLHHQLQEAKRAA